MGGRISVEGEPGRGSTFRFDALFLVPSATSTARDRTDEIHLSALQPIGSARLLLADDNSVNRLVLDAQLRALGHDPRVVASGAEVLAALELEDFDLLLLDCQMPEIDGYETARRIRLREAAAAEKGAPARHLPVVALTAHALPGDREKCLEAGMDDYLAKPFTEEQLTTLLARWLPARPSGAGAASSSASSSA